MSETSILTSKLCISMRQALCCGQCFMLFPESSAGCTLDLSKEDFNLDILFKQLFMYNWPWRCIHILYGWSLKF